MIGFVGKRGSYLLAPSFELVFSGATRNISSSGRQSGDICIWGGAKAETSISGFPAIPSLPTGFTQIGTTATTTTFTSNKGGDQYSRYTARSAWKILDGTEGDILGGYNSNCVMVIRPFNGVIVSLTQLVEVTSLNQAVDFSSENIGIFPVLIGNAASDAVVSIGTGTFDTVSGRTITASDTSSRSLITIPILDDTFSEPVSINCVKATTGLSRYALAANIRTA